MNKTRNVGILIFNDVEVMDFCGPFEVFSVADKVNQDNPFNVFTISEKLDPVYAANNLCVNAKYSIDNCPELDILIIPGGQGARREINNKTILDWIKSNYPRLELLLTVCTGSAIVGKCGLLNGMTVTTHHAALDLLRKAAPDAKVVSGKRYIDNGKIITSGGVSSGIDMSLYVIGKLLGEETVQKTIDLMEYNWH